jgi:hypothetical protein
MAENEQEKAIEMWEKIPFEQKVEIDMAIDQHNKPEAVNRCMCAVKGFSVGTAMNVVEKKSG